MSSVRWGTKSTKSGAVSEVNVPLHPMTGLLWITCGTSWDRAVHISAPRSEVSCWCPTHLPLPQDAVIPHLPTVLFSHPDSHQIQPPACTPVPHLPIRSLLTIAAMPSWQNPCLPVVFLEPPVCKTDCNKMSLSHWVVSKLFSCQREALSFAACRYGTQHSARIVYIVFTFSSPGSPIEMEASSAREAWPR